MTCEKIFWLTFSCCIHNPPDSLSDLTRTFSENIKILHVHFCVIDVELFTFHSAVSEDKHVSKEVLLPLCEYEWVQEWVKVIDYSVYQMLIDIVMPDVLHPIPGNDNFTILQQFLENHKLRLWRSKKLLYKMRCVTMSY